MNKNVIIRILLMAGLLFPPFLNAQSDGSASRKQKVAERKKENRKVNERDAIIKGKKRHAGIQDPVTKRRMKRHRKHSHVSSYDRRPFFIKRWLYKKEH